jgi:hypothetical protein
MRVAVETCGKREILDLTRVRFWSDLKVGGRVLLRSNYSKQLRVGKVIGIVDGCVTVEIEYSGGNCDYMMIESKDLYCRVYRIN